MGRLLTCYAPVRHWTHPEGRAPFDLHVLSAPPAFVLSQDQTLHRVRTALGTNVVTLVRIFVLTVSPLFGTRRTRCLLPAPEEAFRATGRPVQALLNTLIVKPLASP